MEDQLNLITGLTVPQRKKVFLWVASRTETEIINIFQDGVKQSYQLQNERPDLPGKVVKYCAFVSAARHAGWDTITGKGYRVAGEEQYDDFSHLRKAKVADIIRRGRTPVLRRKVLAYWGEIKELKGNGTGFRPISDYLIEKRNLKVTHTYLAQIWKEVETDV
ncbi:MAG: hypothetical protein J0665_09705 [Deltaproteobacteria bacterium]|jgi:hypothetical protein|nr:hypothetical protein [Deltaproteobacteria bacterium]